MEVLKFLKLFNLKKHITQSSDNKNSQKQLSELKHAKVNFFVGFALLGACLAIIAAFSIYSTPKKSDVYPLDLGDEVQAPVIHNRLFSEYQPEVTITVNMPYSDSFLVSTSQVTVSEIIQQLNIDLSETDVVSHPLDSVVEDNMNLVIYDIDYKTVTVDEVIPYTTKIENVQTIPKGSTQLVTEGKNGSCRKTIEQKYVNGELVEQKVTAEDTISEPQTAVYLQGVGGTLIGADGNSYSFSYYLDVIATAYEVGGMTATGHPAIEGVIAVDPTVIPLHSKVYVVGDYGDYGVQLAYDTGGSIKGNKIDLCLPGEESDLLRFGVRAMRAYILE